LSSTPAIENREEVDTSLMRAMKCVTEVDKAVGVSCGGEDRKLSNFLGESFLITRPREEVGKEVEPQTERYERA
jgi:hypothetical protein